MQEIDLEAEKKEILRRYKKLLRSAKRVKGKVDSKRIRKAFDLALDAHSHMRRKSGEPYIYHPIEVAQICAEEIGLGTTSIICALLHDTVEDTDVTLEDLDQMFGPKVANIVDGLTKLSGVIDHNDPNASMQAENFRKMFLTLSDDMRVILIKLADRLHNMRTMEFMPRNKQLKISYETLEIYAPLAHRLGLNTVKQDLESLGLRYTETELYNEIQDKLKKGEKGRTRFINKFSLPVITELDSHGFEFDIKGRPKSIYSIYNKIKNKGVKFEEIYDLFAIRIILDSEPENEKSDCWKVYSVVTDLYTPRPDRLRDWISTPKANGYESLHTTVMGPNGQWVEVQIRSKRMNDIAERGLAAHWKYKANDENYKESQIDDWVKKVTELLEDPSPGALDFIDDFKMNVFSDDVYCFTPKGELKRLPKGASALDFAFEIHSQVGSLCIGAKVNHKLVPLGYKLHSGEQLEIITSKKQKPKEDWLKLVVTAKAKSAIKDYLKKEKRELSFEGKEIFFEDLRKLKITGSERIINGLMKFLKLPNVHELYYRAAMGNIDKKRIKKFLEWEVQQNAKKQEPEKENDIVKSNMIGSKQTLLIGDGTQELDYTLSSCCNAIPGDEVFGFITINQGIKIHKSNCPNAKNLMSKFAYRTIKAQWSNQELVEFRADIILSGVDNMGIVNKVTSILSNEQEVNIKEMNFKTDDGVFEGSIGLLVHDTYHLNHLIGKLNMVDGINKVERSY
jgi:GTP diphosphokinase / guanosine-3',5'-bis(diphosphate) 3'-diphosphatase